MRGVGELRRFVHDHWRWIGNSAVPAELDLPRELGRSPSLSGTHIKSLQSLQESFYKKKKLSDAIGPNHLKSTDVGLCQ